MCEGRITISTELWKKILWNRAKVFTFWKHLKNSSIIAISLYAGFVSVGLITNNKGILFNPLWLLAFWLLLIAYNFIKTYISINSIKEEHFFYVKLNEQGVELSEKMIPWGNYEHFVEYDDYLEIHGSNKDISFLPKNVDTKDIINYTKAHIKKS